MNVPFGFPSTNATQEHPQALCSGRFVSFVRSPRAFLTLCIYVVLVVLSLVLIRPDNKSVNRFSKTSWSEFILIVLTFIARHLSRVAESLLHLASSPSGHSHSVSLGVRHLMVHAICPPYNHKRAQARQSPLSQLYVAPRRPPTGHPRPPSTTQDRQ